MTENRHARGDRRAVNVVAHRSGSCADISFSIAATGDRATTRMKAPRVGDLFSGAGLFSHAFREEGGYLSFAFELDPFAVASYAKNVGLHVVRASVEKVAPPAQVDIIVAGPPCQGFSTLGRRDPKDARNRLCLVVPAWAKATQAKVVVLENVPPFLASESWKLMSRRFRQQGFEIATWCLDAVDFGVPQRRRRSFTIASRIGIPQAPAPTHTRPRTVRDALRAIRRSDPMHIWPKPSVLMSQRLQHLPLLGDRRDLMCLAPDLCPPSWTRIGCQATDVWGRMNPHEPSNTLRCDFQNPSKGRYVHPSQDRMISLREGARIQQVPDEWEFVGHRTAVTRQIGNGVPIGLGRAVARQVLSLF